MAYIDETGRLVIEIAVAEDADWDDPEEIISGIKGVVREAFWEALHQDDIKNHVLNRGWMLSGEEKNGREDRRIWEIPFSKFSQESRRSSPRRRGPIRVDGMSQHERRQEP